MQQKRSNHSAGTWQHASLNAVTSFWGGCCGRSCKTTPQPGLQRSVDTSAHRFAKNDHHFALQRCALAVHLMKRLRLTGIRPAGCAWSALKQCLTAQAAWGVCILASMFNQTISSPSAVQVFLSIKVCEHGTILLTNHNGSCQ